MKRRYLMALGIAAARANPLAAQPAGSPPTIGVLGASTAANWKHWTDAFERRLGELGWRIGTSVAISYRWAEGRTERFAPIVEEFVRQRVSVIVTVGSAVPVAMQATRRIPIVFAIAVDPVGTGMVHSLARPGGNVTGLSTQTPELSGKRLELMRELIPELRRFTIIANTGYAGSTKQAEEVRVAAQQLGLAVHLLPLQRVEDIESAFARIEPGTQFLYVVPDALVNAVHARINALALAAGLPTMLPFSDYVAADGLMSYGADNTDLFRRAGNYVDKILRGADPAEIPVEQPVKFELVINRKTARALGVTIPESIQARADQLID